MTEQQRTGTVEVSMNSQAALLPMLRRPEVERLTGLSCSEIYKRMGEGRFPSQTKLSHKRVFWLREDVVAWMASTYGTSVEAIYEGMSRAGSPPTDPLSSVPFRFLRLAQVKRLVGLSRSNIYRLAAEGAFPAAVSVTPELHVWRSDELAKWMMRAAKNRLSRGDMVATRKPERPRAKP